MTDTPRIPPVDRVEAPEAINMSQRGADQAQDLAAEQLAKREDGERLAPAGGEASAAKSQPTDSELEQRTGYANRDADDLKKD